jgi:hypothetical protein
MSISFSGSKPPESAIGAGKPLSAPPPVRKTDPPIVPNGFIAHGNGTKPSPKNTLSGPPKEAETGLTPLIGVGKPLSAPPPAVPTKLMPPPPPPTRPSVKGGMPPPPLSEAQRAERVQRLFKDLSGAAVDLNTVSDELNKPILALEAALKKLNLGLAAWVELSGSDAGGSWWDRSVGYAKIKDRWAVTLRARDGRHGLDEEDSEELWPFNDAPRWMRIEAVAKLPDLLEALLKQAQDTTQKIKNKIAIASELAEAIKIDDESW